MDALPWTEQVIRYGLQLNKLRAAYFEVLSPLFLDLISKLSDLQITIDFQNGWQGLDTEKDLTALFEKAFNRDNQYGYTQYGPHKADMVIKNNQFKVKNTLSRGQQKLILIALRIAQSQLLNRPCLYLLDDIAAEMDDENLNEILSVIVAQKNQVIMTGLDPKHRVLTNIAEKTFHVKHGVLSD
jgi:DNA replication and repair protein RecF